MIGKQCLFIFIILYLFTPAKTIDINYCPMAEPTKVAKREFVYDLGGIILSQEQIEVARQIYLLNLDNSDVLIKLAFCESSLNPNATNINQSDNHYSVDRGLFQINSYYHPDLSAECVFDTECSARWTNEMITNGKGNLWTCWGKIKNVFN